MLASLPFLAVAADVNQLSRRGMREFAGLKPAEEVLAGRAPGTRHALPCHLTLWQQTVHFMTFEDGPSGRHCILRRRLHQDVVMSTAKGCNGEGYILELLLLTSTAC